jgi:hypothetical protein
MHLSLEPLSARYPASTRQLSPHGVVFEGALRATKVSSIVCVWPTLSFPSPFSTFCPPGTRSPSQVPSDPLRCVWFISILLRTGATTGYSGWGSLSSYWYPRLEAACIPSRGSPMFSPHTQAPGQHKEPTCLVSGCSRPVAELRSAF